MQRSVITLDTDFQGRMDAFNPTKLLLAELDTCIIKGIERVTPMLKFELQCVVVNIMGIRQGVPPSNGINHIWNSS